MTTNPSPPPVRLPPSDAKAGGERDNGGQAPDLVTGEGAGGGNGGEAANANARPTGIIAAGVAIAVIGLGWWQWGHDDEGGPSPAERAVLARLPSGEGETLPDGRQMTMISSFKDADGVLCREYETHRDRLMRISIACREFWDWNRRFSITVISEGELLLPVSGSMQNLDDYLVGSGLGQRLTPEAEAEALAQLAE